MALDKDHESGYENHYILNTQQILFTDIFYLHETLRDSNVGKPSLNLLILKMYRHERIVQAGITIYRHNI